MARSLLEKHKKSTIQPEPAKNNLRVIPGGRPAEAKDHLKDEDWYFIHSFWNSSLFNRHYLRDDFQRKRTERLAEYEGGFEIFLNKLLNLCDSKRHEKFHTWNEDQVVKSWILPVMETLGWWDTVTDEVIPQLTFTVDDGETKRTYRPDLTFVPSQKLKGTIQEKSPGERLEYAKRYGILTLEAKYWDRIRKFEKAEGEVGAKDDLAKSNKGDSASSLAPGGQLLTYLKHLRNDDPVRNHFGIASDGKVWRLYHVDHPESQFFEFDLGDLFFEITSKENITDLTPKQYRCIEEAARYFFYVFSKLALYSETGEPTLVDELLKHRKDYVDAAEPNLKNRFLTAMRFACNGFDRALKSAGIKADLETIRDVAESHIFNILFLKSCEANGIIRHEANTDVSITSIIERISYFDSTEGIDDESNERVNLIPKFRDFAYHNSGIELHEKVLELTEIVQNGGKLKGGAEIGAFMETLFSDAEWSLLKKCHLTNIETVKLLYELGYMEEDGKYRQVPYNIFTPEQLGSIYESFLEFTLSRAESDLEFTKKQWKPISKDTSDKIKRREHVRCPIAKKGELFFTPNNKERKVTGSYYTPDPVVKYIVACTLEPLCKGKTANEILSLKVCDPAMGSGHFLTETLRFLTDKYLDKLTNESAANYRVPIQAKRDVLESCIFGVDINPRAVRLAKMALWLETAYSGKRLEHLSGQLLCVDTLIENDLWKNSRLNSKMGFHALVGNPPYVSELRNNKALFEKYRSHQLTMDYYEAKMDLFHFFIQRGLDFLGDGGCLGFIVPQYWLTRSNTVLLHKKIEKESSIVRAVDFGNNKVFPSAPGMHSSIIILQKARGLDGIEAKVLGASDDPMEIVKVLRETKFKPLTIKYDPNLGRFSRASKAEKYSWYLADETMAQGVVAPQEYVIKGHLEHLPGLKLKDGIFVLSGSELKKLDLSTQEEKYVRPFIEACDLTVPDQVNWKKRWILYIDSKTNKGLLNKSLRLPNIQRHLERFSKINTSSNAPYGLHRARTPDLFVRGSKVLSVRKGKRQCFVWTDKEVTVNQAVIVIKTGNEWLDKLITLYLNSDECLEFFRNTKNQGDIIQVDKEVLLRLPLPGFLRAISETKQNAKAVEGMFRSFDGQRIVEELRGLICYIEAEVKAA